MYLVKYQYLFFARKENFSPITVLVRLVLLSLLELAWRVVVVSGRSSSRCSITPLEDAIVNSPAGQLRGGSYIHSSCCTSCIWSSCSCSTTSRRIRSSCRVRHFIIYIISYIFNSFKKKSINNIPKCIYNYFCFFCTNYSFFPWQKLSKMVTLMFFFSLECSYSSVT